MTNNSGEGRQIIPALDGLRAIALLLTMVYHYYQSWSLNSNVSTSEMSFFQFGWAGVDLFFVLSGFLITDILILTKASPKYFSTFFARRILRLFPLYYLFIFVVLIFVPLIQSGQAMLSKAQQIGLWTYTSNILVAFTQQWPKAAVSHLWSLGVEEQFYLCWPFVVRFFSARRLVWVCLFLIVSAPVVRGLALAWVPHGNVMNYVLLPTRWDSLGAGAMVACFYRSGVLSTLSNLGKYSIVIALCGLLAVVLFQDGFNPTFVSMQMCGFSFNALMFSGLMIIILQRKWTALNLFLSIPFLRKIGKYSYAMYLFHLPLLALFFKTLNSIQTPFYLGLAAWFACVYLSSMLSWRLIESRFLSLRGRFDYKESVRQPSGNSSDPRLRWQLKPLT